jgi:half-pint family poly-U binding splicing factor
LLSFRFSLEIQLKVNLIVLLIEKSCTKMTATSGAGPSMGGTMPFLQQAGEIYVGPCAKVEASLIGLGLSKLTSRQKDDLEKAKQHALEQSIQFVLRRKQLEQQQNQQKLVRYGQAVSLMARLYVGSISLEVREENLRQVFEAFGPIKSLNMCWDTATGRRKGYAFLEYDVPEAAMLALKVMDGKSLGGRSLTVRPPSNMNGAQPVVDMVMEDAKQYSRIYVASIHPDLSETDIRSIFVAFGEIVSVQLAKQHSGQGHRGFGYIEYKNSSSVKEAISGMSNFELGGQLLQVAACVSPPEALNYVIPSSTASILPNTASGLFNTFSQ